MVYLGRIVGVGALPDERMFIAYAVSGRSESSRVRAARIVEDGYHTRVKIGPVDPDKISPEQLAQRDLIFYDGMIAIRKPDSPEGYGVQASNGVQTEKICMLVEDERLNLDVYDAIEIVMRVLGPEGDKYSTPRIVGDLDEDGFYNLAIITKTGYFCSGSLNLYDELEDGKMVYVSTYRGVPGSNDVLVPEGKVEVPMGVMDLSGESAQQIADNFFDSIDPSLVVCTAAALWNPDGELFDLAVRNRNNAKQ